MDNLQELLACNIGDILEWVSWNREYHDIEDRYYVVIAKPRCVGDSFYYVETETLLSAEKCDCEISTFRLTDRKIAEEMIGATAL